MYTHTIRQYDVTCSMQYCPLLLIHTSITCMDINPAISTTTKLQSLNLKPHQQPSTHLDDLRWRWAHLWSAKTATWKVILKIQDLRGWAVERWVDPAIVYVFLSTSTMAAGPEKGTRGSYSIIFCLLDFSGWQIIWGYMTLFPKTPVKRNMYKQMNEVCKPYLLFGLLKTWRYAQTCPTFTHQFLWLWGSPHSKMQMPLLRKLRWRAHRCVPSPQDLEIWNYLCFTSESTRRWVDLRPKPQAYFVLYIICIF